MNENEMIKRLVEKTKICYLGSIHEDGYPSIRAMLKPIRYEGRYLYLHTNTSSKK